MKVLLCGDLDAAEHADWQQALAAAMPEAQWLDLAAARMQAADVQVAVVANPLPGSLQGLPALRLIQSLWAGVDRLLADTTLPAGVPIARMVDPAMNAAMAQTALWAVLSLHRGYFAYQRRQREGRWQVHAQRRADDRCPARPAGRHRRHARRAPGSRCWPWAAARRKRRRSASRGFALSAAAG